MPSKNNQTHVKTVEDNSENICFTIMPFGQWFDTYYETIYKAAIKDAGLSPARADDLYRPSTIVNDIWSYTQSAKIILADLTGKNANVFYELGLAHALAKPAILVAESINDVPFDLRALRVLEYDKNLPNWGENLKNNISKSIKEVLSSPLEAVLPTFLEIDKDSKPTSISEHEKNFLELKYEVDQLRRTFSRQSPSDNEMWHDPERIKNNIFKLKLNGYSEKEITKILEAHGVPAHWGAHIMTSDLVE